MTTQQDITLADATASNGNMAAQDLNVDPATPYTKPAATLRQKLLTTVLPVALAPVAIASVIGYVQTETQLKAKALLQLEEVSLLSSEASAIFLKDALKFPDIIDSDPLLLEAVKAGAQQAEAQGLPQKPIEAVEQQFASTKLLKPNAKLNEYLQRVVKNGQLAEVFVTDKNGFNVGYSNPTSDFVQNDERWWQMAKEKGQFIEEPEFDESSNQNVIAISKTVKDDAGNFIGVTKVGIPTKALDEAISTLVSPNLTESEIVQIVNPKLETNAVVDTITAEGSDLQNQEVTGGADVLAAAKLIEDYLEAEAGDLNDTKAQIRNIPGITDLKIKEQAAGDFKLVIAAFTYKDRFFNVSIIPGTKLVAIASVETAEEAALAQQQLLLFAGMGLLLAGIITALIYWLSNSVSNPLAKLTDTAGEAASGNLDVEAAEEGTQETRTLARTFNTMVSEVKTLLEKTDKPPKSKKNPATSWKWKFTSSSMKWEKRWMET